MRLKGWDLGWCVGRITHLTGCGGYTTTIRRRYLIHFSRVLEYSGAVFTLRCSCHTKPHVWCVSSQHKQLNVCFTVFHIKSFNKLQSVYYTFSTSSEWLWILKYYNICFLPLLSHSIWSQHWLLFKWRKQSHTLTVQKSRRGCKHETVSVRAIVQLQIKQSVQMKHLHNNIKVLTLLLNPDLWLRGPAERQHSEHTPDEMNPLSLLNVLTGPDLSTHTHTRAHLQRKVNSCYNSI